MQRILLIPALALAWGMAQPGMAAELPPPSRASSPVSIRSLDDVLVTALSSAPVLDAARAGIGVAEGDRLQAGLRPNPSLTVEVENIAGSRNYRGFRSAESTYGVSQPVELGGKRGARVNAAEAGLSLARQDMVLTRLNLIRDVTRAYADLAAASQAAALAVEQQGLARETLRIAAARVTAGEDPLVQRRRAEVALSTATIAAARARQDEQSARRRLFALMGVPETAIVIDSIWFETLRLPPSAVPVEAVPDFQRWDTALAQSRAQLAVEQARRYPDITVGAGFRRFEEDNGGAMLLSLSVPLPVFDHNQGNRRRAEQEVLRTEAEARQARLGLTARYADLQAQLIAARDEAELLRRETLPAAEQAFDFARRGYQAGRFALIEVLDAQRALFDARAQRTAAQREFHLRLAEFERLNASPVQPGETP